MRAGAQRAKSYLDIAPHSLVPALEVDGSVLIESPAILEWIEARWPVPPLLPASPLDAAAVRAMAALIGCDVHPLNNLRVLQSLRSDFAPSEKQVAAWISRWIGEGFAPLERLIERHGVTFAFGDRPTLADCCLVPQVYNAERFSVDLSPYPRIAKVTEYARSLAAFVAAAPANQPDADPQ